MNAQTHCTSEGIEYYVDSTLEKVFEHEFIREAISLSPILIEQEIGINQAAVNAVLPFLCLTRETANCPGLDMANYEKYYPLAKRRCRQIRGERRIPLSEAVRLGLLESRKEGEKEVYFSSLKLYQLSTLLGIPES